MNRIAKNRRKRRYEGGSLFIESFRKRFTLDATNMPTDFTVEHRCESNSMVEELMLLANLLVGEHCVKKCRPYSLLRKHEFPKEEKLAKFIDFCES